MQPNAFSDIPLTPANHFKLCFYGAVLQVINQVAQTLGSFEAAFQQFPFLVGYNNELAEHGVAGKSSDDAAVWWSHALNSWEAAASCHLPVRALGKAAALDDSTLTMLLTIGLVEEDARFGSLFESLQGAAGQQRPTAGLLDSWWGELNPSESAHSSISRLQELGLIQVGNPDALRSNRTLQIPSLLWDAMRGERVDKPAAWGRYRGPAQLLRLDELILPDDIRPKIELLPALFASGEVQALIVRGPLHNGRRTLLGAVANTLGCGMLELNGSTKADDERWRLLGPLATLLDAMPVVVLELAPGEMAELSGLDGYDGPLGIVLGKQGGVSGRGTERAISLSLDMPGAPARLRHWAEGFGPNAVTDLEIIAERFHLTSGNIRRAASLAASYGALKGQKHVTPADVQQATRTLNRQQLDTLATRVDASGDWAHIAAAPQTLSELCNLETRCRYRERLQAAVGPALSSQCNRGVRALFSGPSGTGKTLAARLLAGRLQMDLYRLDLSTVVNKYIGETEKNLSQVLSRAEELDVILLLDEGDALLTQRTNVQTSTDRYANLETNYLLQRLESFEGILIVTTNAGDRIDGAFQRRMDVVIDFRPPDAAERFAIWQLHLPPENAIDPLLLSEVAGRCALTGGQIRNAVLHASLLALDDGGVVTSSYLIAAVQREYRKAGAVCPLRTVVGAELKAT